MDVARDIISHLRYFPFLILVSTPFVKMHFGGYPGSHPPGPGITVGLDFLILAYLQLYFNKNEQTLSYRCQEWEWIGDKETVVAARCHTRMDNRYVFFLNYKIRIEDRHYQGYGQPIVQPSQYQNRPRGPPPTVRFNI